ncbi:MAG: class I SAM-dependent methyltransferase [Roseiflexaceae bacterium]|nr:class I SAM-dependent methyltransferase [Roseiflexaceae bacterium]
MRCPSCREPLGETLRCTNGHQFHETAGVLALLDADFARRLRPFTTRLAEIRAAEGQTLPDPAVYAMLPYAAALQGNHEWRNRGYDLAVLNALLPGRPLAVLDVGAWNGWLSNRLALLGHTVTAVDYFDDQHDGLRARQFYHATWRAIQINLADLAPLDELFDLVVLNRCLAFASDPRAFVQAVQQRVKPGGLLVLTGLELFRNPSRKIAAVAVLCQRYQVQYDFELFLAPTRGYLDFGDKAALESLGVAVRPYPQLWRANLRALLRPARPWHAYGVWRRAGGIDHSRR